MKNKLRFRVTYRNSKGRMVKKNCHAFQHIGSDVRACLLVFYGTETMLAKVKNVDKMIPIETGREYGVTSIYVHDRTPELNQQPKETVNSGSRKRKRSQKVKISKEDIIR